MESATESSAESAVLSILHKNISLLNGEMKEREASVIHRVLLFTPSIRKCLRLSDIESAVKEFVSESSPFRSPMLEIIAKYNNVTSNASPAVKASKDIVDYYLASILMYMLLSIGKYEDCLSLINMVITHFMTEGYMDIQKEYIISRACTYLMVLYNRHFAIPSLLPTLLSNYRICCLHNNNIARSALYNCILRVYVSEKQYLTATHFIASAPFPENVSDKQYIRYSYYKALVSTVLLDYSGAEHAIFTIHKKSGGQEIGPFYGEVEKLSILVTLLIGEKPDLSELKNARNVAPYLELATAVMRGDLNAYRRVLTQRHSCFKEDGLDRIVNRLHNTVIRIALVKLCKSYSRISLAEIASVLQLDGAEEARYTCMRNIRDGIVTGSIEGDYFVTEDRETGVVSSRPKELFSRRIDFCLNLRKEIINSSV